MTTIDCKKCGKNVEKVCNRMEHCKDCSIIRSKERRKKYYELNREKEIESKKKWIENNLGRVKGNWKQWYSKNKNRIKEKRKNPEVLEIRRKSAEDYRKRYPEKVNARSKSQNIKIPKGQKCQKCNKRLATQKHHPDYSQPTKLEFLCDRCHTKITYGG